MKTTQKPTTGSSKLAAAGVPKSIRKRLGGWTTSEPERIYTHCVMRKQSTQSTKHQMQNIKTGQSAEQELIDLLELHAHETAPEEIRGYFQHNDNGKWIAYDNHNHNCNIEAFQTAESAQEWLNTPWATQKQTS